MSEKANLRDYDPDVQQRGVPRRYSGPTEVLTEGETIALGNTVILFHSGRKLGNCQETERGEDGVRWTQVTHTGLIGPNNEDTFLIWPAPVFWPWPTVWAAAGLENRPA